MFSVVVPPTDADATGDVVVEIDLRAGCYTISYGFEDFDLNNARRVLIRHDPVQVQVDARQLRRIEAS